MLPPNYQLLKAARAGNLESAREAIVRQANVNTRDYDGTTPLHEALTRGHLGVAHLVIMRGADVNAVYGKRQRTLLHWAAEQSAVWAASFLLQHKAEINALRSDRSTPLIIAAARGHQYFVQLLLEHEALLTPRNSRRVTAAIAAAQAGHEEIVRLIDKAVDSRPARLLVAEESFQQKAAATGQPSRC